MGVLNSTASNSKQSSCLSLLSTENPDMGSHIQLIVIITSNLYRLVLHLRRDANPSPPASITFSILQAVLK